MSKVKKDTVRLSASELQRSSFYRVLQAEADARHAYEESELLRIRVMLLEKREERYLDIIRAMADDIDAARKSLGKVLAG